MPTTIPGNLIFQSPTNNDPLLDLNTQPSLDLQFAASKTLDDRVSGLPLVDHQRDVSSGKSAGTYVGSDGLIKTSKVNLLTYSNNLTAANWTYSGLTAPTSATTEINSPVGGSVFKMLETAVTAEHYFVKTAALPIAISTTVTTSLYINTSLGRSKVRVYHFAQNNLTFIWDLINNTQIDLTGGTSASINSTAVGNGWYKLEWTDVTTAVNNFKPTVMTVTDSNQFSFTGDTSKGFYVAGYQVEEGSTASTYIPTTNLPSAAPRFDHDPETGESLGLLIEESRTNLLLYSEQIDEGVNWIINNVTVTPNSIQSPDGSQTAEKLVETAAAGVHRIEQIKTLVTGTTYTLSAFFKAAERDRLLLRTYDGSQNISTAFSSDGTTTNIENSPILSSNEDFGNGWRRCSITYQLVSGTTGYVRIGPIDAGSSASYQGVNGNGIYLWGAQVEAGSFPTSYIPTSGSTVTRAADVTSITGSNFSSWYNQSEGTVFTEADGEGSRIVGLNDGTDSNRQELFQSGNNVFCFQKNANVNEVNISIAAEDKSVFAYKANDYSVTSSGGSVVTDTSATPPTVNQMSIGNWYNDTGQLNGTISRLTYYPYRLPDATLQEITS